MSSIDPVWRIARALAAQQPEAAELLAVERTKIALRVTDAVITRPDILTETAVGEARAAFSPLQLAEILFDITKWSTQKFYVATGTDAADSLPINAQGVSFFSFDSEGRVAGFAASPNR